MSQSTVPLRQEQEKVNSYFQSQSSFWKDIYSASSMQAEFLRARHAAALALIDDLALASDSHVLEIGCGAGFMSIELAQRGLRVHAIDSVEAMVEQARRNAAEAGIRDVLSLDVSDVYALPFEDGSFDLVILIGVVSWLAQLDLAMQEIVRVIRPGGHVILTFGNRAALPILLDPLRNPVLSPLKTHVKDVLERLKLRHPSSDELSETEVPYHLYTRHFINETLARAGLVKTGSMTVGFGTFTLFHRTVIPQPIGIRLQRWLQHLANKNLPILRSTGMSYLVLARKLAS
jgi:ubiquinone/menaquinone biosynthesis C-methylase UbiE